MANIRTARRSGLVLRNGRNRRETSWLTGPYASTTLASSGATALTLSLTAAELALRPFTVIRTRGFFHVVSDQVAATENWGLSVGCCVVSDQSVAIGVTAVPTPETDRDSDLWFVFESLYGRLAFSDATGLRELGGTRTYDSRAMRKVEDGQDLIQVMEVPGGASSAIIQASSRSLIKLH